MGALGLLGSLIGAQGGSMIGRMFFGRAGGMVGGLIGSMLGGRGGGGRMGGMLGGLGGMFGGGDDDKQAGPPEGMTEGQAEILVRAMCNSAKADGQVDESEVEAIVKQLGDIDADDEAFLRNELQSPLDLEGFIASVPADMAEQVYAVSLLSIEVDNLNEEHYLASLARGLNLSESDINELHDELKVPRLF